MTAAGFMAETHILLSCLQMGNVELPLIPKCIFYRTHKSM